jgi:hypothetical protein
MRELMCSSSHGLQHKGGRRKLKANAAAAASRGFPFAAPHVFFPLPNPTVPSPAEPHRTHSPPPTPGPKPSRRTVPAHHPGARSIERERAIEQTNKQNQKKKLQSKHKIAPNEIKVLFS